MMFAGEAVHVVGQPALLSNLQEQPRTHALAKDRVDEVERVAVFVEVTDATGAKAQMGLLGLLVQEGEAGLVESGRCREVTTAVLEGEAAHTSVDHFRGTVGVNAAGQADNEMGTAVVVLYVVDQIVARDCGNRGQGSTDVAPERMTRPHHLFEEAVDVILGQILVHLQLFEDHHPFAIDVIRGELGIGHDVEENVDPELEVVGRHARPVGRHLFICRGVDDTAYALDRLRNLLRRRSPASALEKEVFDEMGDAANAVVLIAGPDPEHQDQACRGAITHGRRHQTSAAFEGADVEVADAHPSASIASAIRTAGRPNEAISERAIGGKAGNVKRGTLGDPRSLLRPPEDVSSTRRGPQGRRKGSSPRSPPACRRRLHRAPRQGSDVPAPATRPPPTRSHPAPPRRFRSELSLRRWGHPRRR